MLLFYLSLMDSDEDKTKFEQLYHRYKRMMYGVALRMTSNPNDSFIKVLRHLSKIEEVSSQKTAAFLVIILRNTVLDMIVKKNKDATCSIEDISEFKLCRDNIKDHVDQMTLVEILHNLPEKYRDILEMKALYELTDKEIADILNISHAAARKRLERARKELQKQLERGDRQ